VPVDELAAEEAFEAAAAQGDEVGAFNLGFMALRGLGPHNGTPDYARALRFFKAAAAKDLPAAHNGLGVLAFNGWGAEQNFSSARASFERGAALGDPDSHFNMGLILSHGHGVPVDHVAALRCYEAASDAGHWRAPLTLAALHADGVGTEQNCTTAARLTLIFLEERLGWADAVEDAAEAAEDGDPGGALAQLAPLAFQGCEAALLDAAFLVRRGGAGWHSTEQAVERAAALLERAALQGSPEAAVDLGDVLRSQDMEAALRNYRRAADAGSAEGLVNLALLTAGWAGAQRLPPDLLPRNLTAARRLLLDAWDAAPDDSSKLAPGMLLLAVRMSGWLEVARGSDATLATLATTAAVLIGSAAVLLRALRPGAAATLPAAAPPAAALDAAAPPLLDG